MPADRAEHHTQASSNNLFILLPSHHNHLTTLQFPAGILEVLFFPLHKSIFTLLLSKAHWAKERFWGGETNASQNSGPNIDPNYFCALQLQDQENTNIFNTNIRTVGSYTLNGMCNSRDWMIDSPCEEHTSFHFKVWAISIDHHPLIHLFMDTSLMDVE